MKLFNKRMWRTVIPSEPVSPSVWAEKYRRLSRRQSHRPGRWQHDNAPVLKGLMDILVDPRVEELSLVKAAQVGGSEAVRNVIGWLAHYDPDPVLIVLPDENTGKRII